MYSSGVPQLFSRTRFYDPLPFTFWTWIVVFLLSLLTLCSPGRTMQALRQSRRRWEGRQDLSSPCLIKPCCQPVLPQELLLPSNPQRSVLHLAFHCSLLHGLRAETEERILSSFVSFSFFQGCYSPFDRKNKEGYSGKGHCVNHRPNFHTHAHTSKHWDVRQEREFFILCQSLSTFYFPLGIFLFWGIVSGIPFTAGAFLFGTLFQRIQTREADSHLVSLSLSRENKQQNSLNERELPLSQN